MNKCKNKLYEGENLKDFRELVNRYENRYANKIAFEYKDDPKATTHHEISYQEFANDIKALGTALLSLNLQDKKVALIAPNCYEWCTSYLAITTSNISIVPLDKSLPENEIKNLIHRSKVDAVIFDEKYNHVFEEIIQENPVYLKQYK